MNMTPNIRRNLKLKGNRGYLVYDVKKEKLKLSHIVPCMLTENENAFITYFKEMYSLIDVESILKISEYDLTEDDVVTYNALLLKDGKEEKFVKGLLDNYQEYHVEDYDVLDKFDYNNKFGMFIRKYYDYTRGSFVFYENGILQYIDMPPSYLYSDSKKPIATSISQVKYFGYEPGNAVPTVGMLGIIINYPEIAEFVVVNKYQSIRKSLIISFYMSIFSAVVYVLENYKNIEI